MQQVVSLLLKHVNIEPEVELVTAYHIKFIVKLLCKYCGYSITLIFIKLNFL